MKADLNQFSDSDLVSRWYEYVMSHPLGTLWHSSSFLKCVGSSFNYPLNLLYRENEGSITALLALFTVPSFMGNKVKLVAVPVSSWCGVISNTEEDELEILKDTKQLGERMGAEYAEYRQIKEINENLPVKSSYVTLYMT